MTVEAMTEFQDLARRIYEVGTSEPQYIIVSPAAYYWTAVVARDPRWLAMPFQILIRESRGEVEERWARRRKARS